MGGLGNNLSGLLRTSHDMTMIVSAAKDLHTDGDYSPSRRQLRGEKGEKEEKKKITGKGVVVYAVVVRAAMQRGRCDGSEVKFDDNAVVLADKKSRQLLGTRVFGPVPHELRKQKHLKILSLARHVARSRDAQ
ncbi:hypothetical protein ACE6H2_026960 [Prunus campanulata]